MQGEVKRSYPKKALNAVRIILLGDVVGRPGRHALKRLLPPLKEEVLSDLVVVNGENAAGGAGIDQGTAREIKAAGVDVVTLGDHAFQRKGACEFLNENYSWCIRPANLPSDVTPGRGHCVVNTISGVSVRIINLLGRVFISGVMECPFRAIDSWIAESLSDPSQSAGDSAFITICDFHAEATSEKYAMAHHVDGRISLLVGTHTHVQTSDARILPGGTGYITDLGMTGNQLGVIGMKAEVALNRFLSPRPAPYEVAEGDGELRGVIADFDRQTGRALGVSLV